MFLTHHVQRAERSIAPNNAKIQSARRNIQGLRTVACPAGSSTRASCYFCQKKLIHNPRIECGLLKEFSISLVVTKLTLFRSKGHDRQNGQLGATRGMLVHATLTHAGSLLDRLHGHGRFPAEQSHQHAFIFERSTPPRKLFPYVDRPAASISKSQRWIRLQ